MKKLLYIFTMIAAVFFIYSCKGPEGDVGPRGISGDTGPVGEDGLPGQDGNDGIDGDGLYEMDEAENYGYIAVAIEGIRPATVPFEDSVVFDLVLPSLVVERGMSVMFYDSEEDSSRFYIYRMNYENSYLMELGSDISFDYNDDQVKMRSVRFGYKYKIEGGDNVLIYTDDIEESILPENISNYSYDSSTGKLTLQFKVVVPAEDNSTSKELTLRFYVNAVVLEMLNNPIF
jgi:hypothetical protein